MKWLTGGWQRDVHTRDVDMAAAGEGATMPLRGDRTRRYSPQQSVGAASPRQGNRHRLLGPEARDIDVSASSFRNLVVGGGATGFLTVLCAAALVDDPASQRLWFFQLIFGVLFLWFLSSAKGSMASRGFLIDRSGFYARTRGEIFGIEWDEIGAVGIGTLPMIQDRRLVHPQRRRALEVHPADASFPARHPELDRWRVDEPGPRRELPAVRYRFHLPPLNRLPHQLEQAVHGAAASKWIGKYRRPS